MLKNTYTTDDLVERIALMRKYYAQHLFSGGEHLTLANVVQAECEAATFAALEEWQQAFKKEAISPLVVYEALDAIEEDLAGVPAVTLYVPIKFSPEHVERFGKWFRDNVQPNILLTLRTDPRAAGGCAFIWKSTYYDHSLRYFIQQNRAAIVKTFNKYTHATT